ncbi:VWA domain-containing protein [Flammeovirgaceae bacterium SG7u.111]|nr:VWA domain-containing protein [Flammeovirgaceae bacterium SG7u.132]WPO37864.1 VWA domain-containing protein [Flammeovirgaceae bacterium SG7u.111]
MKNLLSLLFLFLAAITTSAQESVKLTANTEYAHLLEGIPNQKVYAYIELEGAKDNLQKERPPLNLAVVIDKSGSMGSENKLEYVKQACQIIIDNLEENDILSIVTYDTDVDVLKKAGKIENKEILKSKVKKLTPGSSTNLSEC